MLLFEITNYCFTGLNCVPLTYLKNRTLDFLTSNVTILSGVFIWKDTRSRIAKLFPYCLTSGSIFEIGFFESVFFVPLLFRELDYRDSTWIALEKENTTKTVKENPDFRHTSSPPKKKRKSSATPNK